MPWRHLDSLRIVERGMRCQRQSASLGFGHCDFERKRREIGATSLQQFLIRQPAVLRFQLFAVDLHALQCTTVRSRGA
jgi:hypothetical protein